MRPLLVLLLLSACDGSQATTAVGDKRCMLADGNFVLNLGQTKAPTYAFVILPNGESLRLRYAPDGVDTLGQNYDRGKLQVPIGAVTGVGDSVTPKKVFSVPGVYRFVMHDANTAEGMDLHRVECEVVLGGPK